MCERLWGENYFNPAEKKWTKEGDTANRAFNMFILDPIGKIVQATMNDQLDKLEKMLSALNIKMKKEDLELKVCFIILNDLHLKMLFCRARRCSRELCSLGSLPTRLFWR